MRAMEILFHDNHLLAVHKPPGWLTQPAPGGTDSLEDRAKAWVKTNYDKPGAVFLEAVHRIDRPVSGVVLFARTSKALRRCHQAIRERQWKKIYLAVVSDQPPARTGELRDFLTHGDRRALVADAETPDAREAILRYEILHQDRGRTLLRIHLLTGRYHQIRAQLAHAGCPILGDHKYGGGGTLPDQAIALHHHQLDIEHPVRRTPCRFIAPPPCSNPWNRFPPVGTQP